MLTKIVIIFTARPVDRQTYTSGNITFPEGWAVTHVTIILDVFNLTVQGPLPCPLIVTSGGHLLRPVQMCSPLPQD